MIDSRRPIDISVILRLGAMITKQAFENRIQCGSRAERGWQYAGACRDELWAVQF